MPLVVPILRLGLLFLNVYETFKTLRSPRRSSRHGELLLRSVSQRKRAMKGCMAVWLVWCTTVMTESFTDKTFGLITPFYSEMKALVYLFQIVTRAHGAEPLYLHVLRPCIKPYVATLDLSLDIVQNVGELLFLILALPYYAVTNWWNPSKPVAPEDNANHDAAAGSLREVSTSRVQTRSARRAQESLDLTKASAKPSGLPHSRSDSLVQSTSKAQYEVWHPPKSARDRVHRPGAKGTDHRVVSDPTIMTRRTLHNAIDQTLVPGQSPNEIVASEDSATSINAAEDWRSYPPFPSAYPPTPQAAGSLLPSGGSSSSVSTSESLLSAIKENAAEDANSNVQVIMDVEEWRQYPPFPSAYPPTPQTKPLPTPTAKSTLPALESVIEQDPFIEQPPIPPSKEPVKLPDEQQKPLTSRRKYRPINAQSQSQSLPTRTRRRTRPEEEVSELGTRRRRRPRPDDSSQDVESGIGQDFGLSLERLRESVVVPNSQSGSSDDRKGTIRGIRGLQSNGQGERALGTGGPMRVSKSNRGQRLADMSGIAKPSQAKSVPSSHRSLTSRSIENAPSANRTTSSYSLSTNHTANSASTTSLSSQPPVLSRTSSTASDASTSSVAGTKRPSAALIERVPTRKKNMQSIRATAPGSRRIAHKSTSISKDEATGPASTPILDKDSEANEPDTLESSGEESSENDEFQTPKPISRRREPTSKRRRIAEPKTLLDSD